MAGEDIEILTVLADGFEEIEAVAVIDVMRRLGCKVLVAGLGNTMVTGAHGLKMTADVRLADIDVAEPDAIFLPGGMPGAESLRKSSAVLDLVRNFHSSGRVISAICAAPMVLAEAGILDGVTFTMYPGFDAFMHNLKPSGRAAESDGGIVTGRGPGAVFAFARKLAEALGVAPAKIDAVMSGMFVEE
ncbi:MAG: DJ-1/PfpI family protein [Victivallaceae bacterium]|nr:DJ-1/PfpI family protein [Victivallaceae bacterium]